MTRKHVNAAIKEALEAKGVQCDPEEKESINTAVDTAFDYALEFAQDVSRELVAVGLYSEAMVAGMFVKKLKTLRNGTS